MKTPARSTRTRVKKQRADILVKPWGDAPQRVLVHAAAAGAPVSTARAQLKARVQQDHPEGKALARLRYFTEQRGLPAPSRPREGPTSKTTAPAARTLMRSVMAALAPSEPASFKAAAQLPAWRELGPTLVPHGQTYGSGAGSNPSVSGRCCGIVVDRSNSRHLVLCSAGGGLWGSRDAGATWAPLTDRQPTLVMGAVAQAPSAPHVMYAATGDGDSQLPYGVGLLRSADAGATWNLVPSAALTGVCAYDLAVDPVDALHVFIASTAALHVSADGGKTVRSAIDDNCWSVSVHPTKPLEVLAACAGGLMRSVDGGNRWSRVGLPSTSASTAFSRLEVCHAPSNPEVVFVAGCVGERPLLWRRASFGGAFTAERAPGDMNVSQAWYDWNLHVAPHDANLVYWGAVELYRGKRGSNGMAWSNISSRTNGDSIHPDQHFVGFDPNEPRVIYACNDGGVFRSPDGGDHWKSLNPGLGITEFEFLAQLDSVPDWLLGGTQDNGSLASAGPLQWDQVALGDGGDCAAIDRGAASICYHSFYDMPVERAAALGPRAFAWTDVSPKVPEGYAAQFYPPLEARGSQVAKAGATLWVSADEGKHWDEVELPTSGAADPDLASAMHFLGDGVILLGTMRGAFYRISRGSGTWAAASVVTLSSPRRGAYLSDMATVVSGRTLWVTSSTTGGGHVFRSTDAGKTWVDRSANLPDIAVNAIVVDPKDSKRIYLATDQGVWRSTNAGVSWSAFSNGLPNVIVGDLILHAGGRRLLAGTRSRGAWELSL
jgi:photosystem II stability/assembly factor-like uncharacterized protein